MTVESGGCSCAQLSNSRVSCFSSCFCSVPFFCLLFFKDILFFLFFVGNDQESSSLPPFKKQLLRILYPIYTVYVPSVVDLSFISSFSSPNLLISQQKISASLTLPPSAQPPVCETGTLSLNHTSWQVPLLSCKPFPSHTCCCPFVTALFSAPSFFTSFVHCLLLGWGIPGDKNHPYSPSLLPASSLFNLLLSQSHICILFYSSVPPAPCS